MTTARRWVRDPVRWLLRLRWGLTLGCLLVTAAAVAGAATWVVRADTGERDARLDARMQTEAYSVAALARVGGGATGHQPAPGTRVAVLRGAPPTRQVFATGRTHARVPGTAVVSLAVRAADGGVVARATNGAARLLAVPVTDTAGGTVAVVVVTADASRPSVSLLLALALAGGGALLLVACGVHLLSGRTIASMRTVLQQHTRFVADATRDLRQPIADLRKLALDAVGDRRRRDDLPGHAVRLCTKADDVVDDVLVGAKLDAGTFPLLRRPVRLDWLVETDATTAAGLAGAVDRLDVATRPCTVRADAFLIRHAVGHLVDAALAHGAVEVRVFGDGRVTVADRGPGVESAVAAALNHPSGEVSPELDRGLVVCCRVALLHGGTLTVAQRQGGGAVWTLRLRPEATGLGPTTPGQQTASVSPGTWE